MHSIRKPKSALISAASWFPRIKCTLLGYSTCHIHTTMHKSEAIELDKKKKKTEKQPKQSSVPSEQEEELSFPNCAVPGQHNLLGIDNRYI